MNNSSDGFEINRVNVLPSDEEDNDEIDQSDPSIDLKTKLKLWVQESNPTVASC